MTTEDTRLLWANFFQFSYNSYTEDAVACGRPDYDYLSYKPFLRWDDALWDELTREMASAGVTHVVLSLGDGIRYESHPEIAVEGAWTPAEMRSEIARLKVMGIEVIPKLNFSTGHDLWLGDYARMVSTPTYYQVCSELIAEVIAIFDTPALFHLGYDEETAQHQSWYEYVVIRQHDLWWRDFLWFVEQVESRGSRPWIWSDFIWDHTGEFLQRMPRSVVQSNWYYGPNFDLEIDARQAAGRGIDLSRSLQEGRDHTTPLHAYLDLEAGQFDQILTGSTWQAEDNFPDTVTWAQEHLHPGGIMGFMQSTWRPMLPAYRDHFLRALEKLVEGKERYRPDGWRHLQGPS